MRNRVLTSILVSFLAVGVLSPTFANPKGVPNSNAAGYWTQERRDNAIAREFQFEPGAKVGKLVPQARRGGSGGGSTSQSGTLYWPAKQQSDLVANITGKVFFSMSGTDYVCSASLVSDNDSTKAIVITAGHCVWENAMNGSFASNWVFWPNFDPDYNNQESFVASQLFVRKEFTNQTAFNTTAVIYDYAFAVINSNAARVNPSNLPTLGNFSKGNTGYAFGYPQAFPYNGQELVYSFGSISTDSNTGNKTWKLPSSLTGGASGGPWYSGYSNGNNIGAVSSVNSYKYNSDKNSMYGPQFSQSTLDLLTAAKNASCAITTTINCTVLP